VAAPPVTATYRPEQDKLHRRKCLDAKLRPPSGWHKSIAVTGRREAARQHAHQRQQATRPPGAQTRVKIHASCTARIKERHWTWQTGELDAQGGASNLGKNMNGGTHRRSSLPRGRARGHKLRNNTSLTARTYNTHALTFRK